jgi:hypothetical protein
MPKVYLARALCSRHRDGEHARDSGGGRPGEIWGRWRPVAPSQPSLGELEGSPEGELGADFTYLQNSAETLN